MKIRQTLTSLILALFICSCASNKYDPTLNLVLKQMNQGKDLLEKGQLKASSVAFDDVLNNIEIVWGEDEAAERARSLWHEEGAKAFKGEPYERAMAYYYRGVIYLLNQDMENARACFRSGLRQDSFTEEEQKRSDFISLYFLLAYCEHNLGRPDRAAKVLEIIEPALKKKIDLSKNVLIIAETGASPRKLRDGVGQNKLVYRRGKKIKTEFVQLSSTTPQDFDMVESLYWQASSRGGRPVDAILEGKVKYKKGFAKAGSALSSLGVLGSLAAPAFNDGNAGAIAGGNVALGAISSLISMKVNAKADNRYWSNLPDKIHFLLMSKEDIPAGGLKISYLDKNKHALSSASIPRPERFYDVPTVLWMFIK